MIARAKLFPKDQLVGTTRATSVLPAALSEPLQVTIREAARLLAYDERTIRRLIASGDLVAIGQGRLRRVPVASLRAYQERNRSHSPHHM